MRNLDVVVQGPIRPETSSVVINLLQTTFIERIILSCWESCPEFPIKDSRISIIRNSPPSFAGTGNRNFQIKSSQAGVLSATSDFCAKIRSDQIISIASLEMMNRFAKKFREPEMKYVDGSGPKTQMFVSGDFWPLAFHPRDHLFWSDTESMRRLFDVPLDTAPFRNDNNYEYTVRAETYIAVYYYALFHPDVKKMIENPIEYLCDKSPKRFDAMELTRLMRNKVFKVFPRIELHWPKHQIYGYKYAEQSFWERWHDESWES